MNRFYKRVRLFCELRVRDVSRATGLSEFAIDQIEKGRRKPNDVEQRLLEQFLRDRLRIVFEMDGPMPEWVRGPQSKPIGRLTAARRAD